ncbi:MAG TPA: hypothetical protein PLQ88_11550 [Blastocatellia bacterium]|nr:hypothetical protein [Blastocatellia bacterium]HMY72458.1 hypothetical protein [Blastocatellia bacterium]HNG29218.1 hypothetical protein [Blastocatellia bacterium]
MEILKLIGIIASIVTPLVTASTVYLRLFVRNELQEMRHELIKELRKEFVSKELFDLKTEDLERRLLKFESASARAR